MSKPSKAILKQMVTVPRRWGSLPTVDGYVMREFMVKFSILIMVFAILFVLSDVFNDLSDFLDEGAPVFDTIRYFLLRLPGNITFVLPISVLLGCMWTMAMFGKNLEVTAMRASGLSLLRCGRSIFLVGILVSLVNIYFNEMLVPQYNLRAEQEMTRLTRKPGYLDDYQKLLVFKSFDDHRTWRFETFDDGGEYHGVTLKMFREDGTLDRYITCNSAEYHFEKGWIFHDGSETEYTLDGFMSKGDKPFETLIVGKELVSETPVDIKNAVRAVDQLPCWTILEMLTNSEFMSTRARGIYWTMFWYRLAFPWASFIAVFLGIPLATKNERSGIMMAVITAVVIIVAYIVTSEAFKVFGQWGIIPPLVAGLSPTLAFIAYGYWNVRRDQI